jgi:hypothetical protein
MARRILAAIKRPLRHDDTPQVHFHQGPSGSPMPCFDARCDIPQLDVG